MPDDTTESVATQYTQLKAATINQCSAALVPKMYDPEVRDEGAGQP